MRRTAVILFVLIALTLALAPRAAGQQYAMDRGVWILGGGAGLSHGRSTCTGCSSSSYTSLDIFPQVGYFVAPGLAITADLNFWYRWGTGISETQYGAGPGVAYYFTQRPARLHPFVKAGIRYFHVTSSQSGTSTVRYHSFQWQGSAGLALMVARNVAVTGEAYYRHIYSHSSRGGFSNSSTHASYGTSFGVAVFLY